MQIENPSNWAYTFLLMLNGTPTNTSFGYVKRYAQGGSAASTEDFCWLAIGESSEVTSGNVPYCKGDTGVQILTGNVSGGSQSGTVIFNTSYPFSSAAKVFMSLLTTNALLFSIELKGSPTTTGFSYNKHYSASGLATSEPFSWLAIGNRSASGNVPVCPQLSGPKIFYGKYADNVAIATITFPSAFSSTPVVLLTIIGGGNFCYGVTTTAVSTTSFTFSKRFNNDAQPTSEDIWWLAIGV